MFNSDSGMNTRYARILLTGSSGVLGFAFRLVRDEYPQHDFIFSTSRECDLRNAAATYEYVRRVRPDAIIHLAAVSGGIALSRAHPASLLRDNVLMTLSILEASRQLEVPKTIMTLSSGMYPPGAPLPLKECDIHAGPADESNYGYAYAKRLIEPAIRAYRTEFAINVIGLVPNGIFGEHDRYSSDSATFIASLIYRFYELRNSDQPLVVWGDGSARREITYGKDMARAFMWCLLHYDDASILNVGTSEEHSVGDIALMVADALGIDRHRVQFDVSKPGGVLRKSTAQLRFLNMSGFRFSPLRDSLRQTLEWFDSHNQQLDAAQASEAGETTDSP